MAKGAAGLKQTMLGIWYDKNGVIKRLDVKGMSLEALIEALIARREAKKHGITKRKDSK